MSIACTSSTPPHLLFIQLPPDTDISAFLTELLTKTKEFEEHKKVCVELINLTLDIVHVILYMCFVYISSWMVCHRRL